ncbi:MAG: class IV adenylate cyclase [Anaerohalosphaeraceae bacterium]
MSLEIEAKIRVADLKTIAERLTALHAALKDTVQEDDIYFDNVSIELIQRDCGLRLRKRLSDKQPPQIVLTYKGPRQKSAFKSRSEYQIQVQDGDTLVTIFEHLGFRESLRVIKTRQLWQLGECEICLDEVYQLGLFVEVEGPSETAIQSILDKLGLNPANHISDGYARMMAARLNPGK